VEAESAAADAVAHCRIEAVELVEHALTLRFRDAGADIKDVDPHASGAALEANLDWRRGRRVFERVVEERRQRLLQACWINLLPGNGEGRW